LKKSSNLTAINLAGVENCWRNELEVGLFMHENNECGQKSHLEDGNKPILSLYEFYFHISHLSLAFFSVFLGE